MNGSSLTREPVMTKDGIAKELRRMLLSGISLTRVARMLEMDPKTVRKYRDSELLPSQMARPREYRTRVDPFAGVWDEVAARLEAEPRLKAYTLFQWLGDQYPGEFPESTRRTFERRVSQWRAQHGPAKEVTFPQEHPPGLTAASDFTSGNSLSVTIAGTPFEHMLYHCVLTHSNYETFKICYSESFEALSDGIQQAFWTFGGVPRRHRTDSLAAAVRNHTSQKLLTGRYQALMDHYGCKPQRINVRKANENGDVESLHGKLKDRIDQQLLLRGSRDFASRKEYEAFVQAIIDRANAGRSEKYAADRAQLLPLPASRLDTGDLIKNIRVSCHSTIQVRATTYSVPSRLIGKTVDVKLSAESIRVTHAGKFVQSMPRLKGKGQVCINYRHVIDSLVRKQGAFEHYRYHDQMFPRTIFRTAYDLLGEQHSDSRRDKEYLRILNLAANESEELVAAALFQLIANDQNIDFQTVSELVQKASDFDRYTDVNIDQPDLSQYDHLLSSSFSSESDNKEVNHDNETNEQEIIGNKGNEADCFASERFSRSDGGTDGASGSKSTQGTVQGTATSDFPGPLRGTSQSSGDGTMEPHAVLGEFNGTGVASEEGRTSPPLAESISIATWQDMGEFRFQAIAIGSESSCGNLANWYVLESAGECFDFWEARFGENAPAVCVGRTVDSSGPKRAVYDLQSSGAAVVAGEAGPEIAEVYQATIKFRSTGDRRLGLRTTKPRGDGGAFHASGGALRAGECHVDEQPAVQQMGADLQRRHDDGSGNRSLSSPQRDRGIECSELPSGNGKAKPTISFPTSGELILGLDRFSREF